MLYYIRYMLLHQSHDICKKSWQYHQKKIEYFSFLLTSRIGSWTYFNAKNTKNAARGFVLAKNEEKHDMTHHPLYA